MLGNAHNKISVRIANKADIFFVNKLIIDPKIKRHISDDLSFNEDVKITNCRNFYIIEEEAKKVGFFLAIPVTRSIVDLHTAARYCSDIKTAFSQLEKILIATGFKVVQTLIPNYNKAAKNAAEMSGFKMCGTLPESYFFKSRLIDQYIFYKQIRSI